LISGFRPSVPVPEQGASNENPIEMPAKWEFLRAIHHDAMAPQFFETFQAMPVQIAGDRLHSVLQRLGRFVAGRGAQV